MGDTTTSHTGLARSLASVATTGWILARAASTICLLSFGSSSRSGVSAAWTMVLSAPAAASIEEHAPFQHAPAAARTVVETVFLIMLRTTLASGGILA